MQECRRFEHWQHFWDEALLCPPLAMLLKDFEDQANSLLPDRIGPVLQVIKHRLDDFLIEEGKR